MHLKLWKKFKKICRKYKTLKFQVPILCTCTCSPNILGIKITQYTVLITLTGLAIFITFILLFYTMAFCFMVVLGGSTFCAVAALFLMNRLKTSFSEKKLKQLQRWCVCRQQSGFQGRPNKPTDTCYSFWVGATLKVIIPCYQMRIHNICVFYMLIGWGNTLIELILVCFWLKDTYHLINSEFNRGFLMETQGSITGGFSKWPDHTPGKCFTCMS